MSVDPRWEKLVIDLMAGGMLPERWRDIFLHIPRHAFIPDVIWLREDRASDLLSVSRDDKPDVWWDQIHADESIITQVDDGQTPPGQRGRLPSSSASMPTMVAEMLAALDVRPGQRVLEIGTGTGYNAALLCAMLGDENVTTVDVDPGLTEQARDALRRAGFSPTVVTADGAAGYAPGAPYDRVIATCTVERIPYAWVAQTAPGGVIVTPWETAFGVGGVLLRLTVDHAGVATGRVVGDAEFMWLRDQRLSDTRWAPGDALAHGHAVAKSDTTIDPNDIFTDEGADFMVGAAVPGCQVRVCDADDGSGEYTAWLHDPDTGSGASVDFALDVPSYVVEQAGTRALWDEVAAAYRQWIDVGQPDRDRFGVTVTRDGQYVWVDTPDNAITPTR